MITGARAGIAAVNGRYAVRGQGSCHPSATNYVALHKNLLTIVFSYEYLQPNLAKSNAALAQ
jgi:hypothetical protein